MLNSTRTGQSGGVFVYLSALLTLGGAGLSPKWVHHEKCSLWSWYVHSAPASTILGYTDILVTIVTSRYEASPKT